MGYPTHTSAFELAYHSLSILLQRKVPDSYPITFPSRRAAIDFRIRFGVFRNILAKSKDEEERARGHLCKSYKGQLSTSDPLTDATTLTFVQKDLQGHFPQLHHQFQHELEELDRQKHHHSASSSPARNGGVPTPTLDNPYPFNYTTPKPAAQSPLSEDVPATSPPTEDDPTK